MRKVRKLLGVIFLICALVVLQLPASEATAASSASDFVISNESVLTKYKGAGGAVSIPNGVMTIATDAFKDATNVTSITIPSSVTKIEPYAFWGCSLQSVSLGTGLESIGDFAFANCKSLKIVTIPENVNSVGIYAFQDCISLTDAYFTYKTMDIHETAFDGCYKLIIHADEGTYPYNYAKKFYIRQQEFPEYEDVPNYNPGGNDSGNTNDSSGDDSNTSSGSVNFIYNPDGTVSPLTDYSSIIAQIDNGLGSSHIVGNQAVIFMDGSSPNVYSGDMVPQYEENGEPSNENSEPSDGNTETSDGNGQGATKYTIVDGEIVADQAYYQNSSLAAVTLPDTIKEIGQFAFARSSVNKIELPNGLERIDYGAFYHADNLDNIVLPDSVMVVEPKAFEYTAWVENFLEGSTGANADDFLISGGVLVAYRGNAATVNIPEGVRTIAAQVFEGHKEIETVSIPDSLKVVGEEAFYNCTSLSKIDLENSQITNILDRAFYGTSINDVTIPETTKTIGINAFNRGIDIAYKGANIPEITYEETAQRLSNSELRENAYSSNRLEIDLTGASNGVTVVGAEDVEAYLEAADNKYVLTVTKELQNQELVKAMARAEELLRTNGSTNNQSYSASDLRQIAIYDLELTDKSGISITKLGKIGLTVAIKLDDINNELSIFTTDRNGQLEELVYEIVNVDENMYVRFTTYHLSPFAIYSTGASLDENEIIETNEVITALASNASQNSNSQEVNISQRFADWAKVKSWRLIVAGLLVVSGFILIFAKTNKIKKK